LIQSGVVLPLPSLPLTVIVVLFVPTSITR
jgi:hypothetical protein